jgi:two-component system response regulator HydG
VEIADRLRAARGDWEVVLLDVGLPGLSGVDLLRQFRDSGSQAAVIMLTGDDSAATATTCLKSGAFHYLTKPCLPIELASIVESAARHAVLRRRLARGDEPRAAAVLIGDSPAMRKLQIAVDKLVNHDVAVLIQGESGTGKELVARALHAAGPRNRPFLAINCSAIPDTLIDSELFGHARGAYTGATADRAGVFVEADGGALFLDEIGDMPLHVQARLLRVLQEGEVKRVGSNETVSVDTRVIAATNVDLEKAKAEGRFREDLYYRLNVVSLHVPPLADRGDDIVALIHSFGTQFQRKLRFTDAAVEWLCRRRWPGNVRELRNAVERLALLADSEAIDVADLEELVGAQLGDGAREVDRMARAILALPARIGSKLDLIERAVLHHAVEMCSGNKSAAARLLGVNRKSLERKLDRLADPPELEEHGPDEKAVLERVRDEKPVQ